MNIDLMITENEEAGLISDTAFSAPVSGVIYEHESGKIFLEFEDMDSKEMNVPVDLEFRDIMAYADTLYVGVIENRVITDARIVPIAHIREGGIA